MLGQMTGTLAERLRCPWDSLSRPSGFIWTFQKFDAPLDMSSNTQKVINLTDMKADLSWTVANFN